MKPPIKIAARTDNSSECQLVIADAAGDEKRITVPWGTTAYDAIHKAAPFVEEFANELLAAHGIIPPPPPPPPEPDEVEVKAAAAQRLAAEVAELEARKAVLDRHDELEAQKAALTAEIAERTSQAPPADEPKAAS